MLRGEKPSTDSVNSVKGYPKEFTQWLTDHREQITKAQERGTLPYFIKDNQGAVDGILEHKQEFVSEATTTKTITNIPYKNSSSDVPTHFIQPTKEATQNSAVKIQMPATIEQISEEFSISGMNYLEKTNLMKFDLLGLKHEIEQIGQQYGFSDIKASVSIFQNGNWLFKINNDDDFSLSRSFITRNDGSLEAMHNLFTLTNRLQGKGISKRLFRNMYKSYQNMGVRYMSVYANINVGGYTWARYGFSAENQFGALTACVTNDNTLKSKYNSIVEEWYSENKKPADSPFPMNYIIEKLGANNAKKVLRGGSWQGILDLQDTEQVAVFEKYLGLR